MTITETKQAVGSWAITLRRDTPRHVLDALTYFGHLVIHAGNANVQESKDNLLATARYVGVFRARSAHSDYVLEGAGMALWLGDEDGKGSVFETPVNLTAQTFANSVTALLPPSGSITAGTIHSVAGTYTNRHQWETPRKALTYLTDTFSTPSVPVEWRVNNNGTLDAGPVANLFTVTPKVMILPRRAGHGRDLSRVSLPGSAGLSKDVNDYTTRVVLLAEGEGSTIATGDADAVGVTAKDIHGNTVKFTRLVSESDTSAGNADARAQLMLNRFSSARSAVELSSSAYDVKGEARVGDYVDVFDPDNGFTDPAREVIWEGETLQPVALRCVEMTWPVIASYTVAFRDGNGVWTDLTPYFVPEVGDTSIVVGELATSWSGVGSEPIGSRPSVDTSTPSTPAFLVPFDTAAYQSQAANDIRAAVLVKWTEPLNVDGSTILDGDHYELRYRTTQVFSYPVTWAALCGFSQAVDTTFDYTVSSQWGDGWSVTGGAASDYNVSAGAGRILLSAANSGRRTYKGSVLNGFFSADVRKDLVAVGANGYAALNLRHDVVNDHGYMVQLRFNTDSSLALRLVRRISGAETTVVNVATVVGVGNIPLVHDINAYYRLEATLQTVGGTTRIKCRAYPVGDRAPLWAIDTTDSTAQVQVAGTVGIRAFRGAGSTDVSTVYVDRFVATAWGTGFTWDQAQTWGRPLSSPASSGEWQTAYAGWDTDQFLLQELTVAAQYEVQIRAVDAANPPNSSAWSASEFIITGSDLIPPAQPAAPVVASSRIAIQVLHYLGAQSGGTFNLAPDLHHFEIHVGSSAGFFPDITSQVGTLSANESNIVGQIPAVGTFPIEDIGEVWVKVIAVDRFGNKSSASEAVTAQAELIDSAHISDLTASKITAGTISATLLLSGTIKTGETGQRAELNQYGLQLYDENGELTVNITADDSVPNFFAVTDGPENTLASIDQEGNISGQTISAATAIILDGDDLQTVRIDPLPRGILAYGEWTQADEGSTAYTGIKGAGNQDPFMELSFVAEAGRRYRIRCNSQLLSTVVNEEYAFELRDGGASEPTTSSTRLTRSEIAGGAEAFAVDLFLEYLGEFSAGLHRLLWTFMGFDGQARVHLANHPATMYIEDCGSSVLVGESQVMRTSDDAPPPVTTYTKTYNCNWYGSYTGSGSKKTDANTANQGQYSSTHGNQRSLLGFPYSTIMSDLSGATITKCEVTLYATHWYYNAGGTAVIGTHSYTSEPSTWADGSVNQNRLTSAGWPKPGKRTVNLGTTIGNDFKSGAAKGIALGPGNNTSWDYYGKFSGNDTSTTSNRPVLKITYTK